MFLDVKRPKYCDSLENRLYIIRDSENSLISMRARIYSLAQCANIWFSFDDIFQDTTDTSKNKKRLKTDIEKLLIIDKEYSAKAMIKVKNDVKKDFARSKFNGNINKNQIVAINFSLGRNDAVVQSTKLAHTTRSVNGIPIIINGNTLQVSFCDQLILGSS